MCLIHKAATNYINTIQSNIFSIDTETENNYISIYIKMNKFVAITSLNVSFLVDVVLAVYLLLAITLSFFLVNILRML